jgi:hypothetical protein
MATLANLAPCNLTLQNFNNMTIYKVVRDSVCNHVAVCMAVNMRLATRGGKLSKEAPIRCRRYDGGVDVVEHDA